MFTLIWASLLLPPSPTLNLFNRTCKRPFYPGVGVKRPFYKISEKLTFQENIYFHKLLKNTCFLNNTFNYWLVVYLILYNRNGVKWRLVWRRPFYTSLPYIMWTTNLPIHYNQPTSPGVSVFHIDSTSGVEKRHAMLPATMQKCNRQE